MYEPLRLSDHSQPSEEPLPECGYSDMTRRDTRTPQGTFKSPMSLVLWVCIGISLSSSITVLALLLHHPTLNNSPPSSFFTTHVSPGARRPNPYMNLERVYQKGSSPAHPKFPSFYTFPHVVMQIDAADPKRAFLPEKHRSYSSEQGFIYSDDRFFEASAKRSTIVQFRNQDFGMENCTLQPTIPLDSSTTDFDPAAQFLLSSTIDIWMLDNSREISRHDLWDRAPPRKHLFTQITIDGKGCKECHLRYPCPSASFSTFEFACSSESVDCLVNFWQRKRTSPNGIYVVQHDSLTLQDATPPAHSI